MKGLLSCLLLCCLLVGCGSDDTIDSCETRQPVEQATGETRIAFSWQDITEDQEITEYEIEYGVPGFVLGNGISTTTNPVTDSSSPDTQFHVKTLRFEYETDLDFYYRAVCRSERGIFFGPVSLSTLAFGEGCTPPSDLVLVKVTDTTIMIEWEGYDEEEWMVSWGSNDGTDGGDATSFVPEYEVTGLVPGLTYLLNVSARCKDEEFIVSDFEFNPSITFTTLEE